MGFEAVGAAVVEWWAAIGTAGQFLVRAIILIGVARALSRPASGGALGSQGRNISVRQTISPWQVVFGQARIGGDLTFIFLSSDKKYLHIIVTLACHECEEIGDIWLDDEVVSPSMLNANGEVISGRYARYGQTQMHTQAFVTSGIVTTATTPTSVQSVGEVVHLTDTITQFIPFEDVSPASPTHFRQYKQVGAVFSFHAVDEGHEIAINYTDSLSNFMPICRIKKSRGNETVQPFPDLVAESEGKWTDAHRQTGHAKVYLRFETSGLSAGAPAISAVVKGAKLYDPRTGLTAWSANPVLARLAYLTSTDFGLGTSLAEIGLAEFITAANVCDERVLLASATTIFTADPTTDGIALATGSKSPVLGDGVRVSSAGTLPSPLAAATTYYPFYVAGVRKLATSYANALAGTAIDITTAGSGIHTLTYYDEQRYQANGAFRLSERPVDILERLLAADAGTLTQVSNSWRTFSGAYEAATLTLTEKDFAGPIQIEPLPPRDRWANGAKGVFVNPNANWQSTDFPVLVPTAAYLAADGGETIYADLDFSAFVTSSSQAQRLARIEVRKRRSGLTVTALFKLTAWRAFTGHSVALTFAKYGWSAKEFTILDLGFVVIQGEGGQALGVQLALRETNASIFSWSAEDQLQGTPPSTSLPNPFAVAAPGAPSVVETTYETSGSAGVKSRATVSWTAVVDPLVKSYEVSWKNVVDADYKIVAVPNGTALNVDDLEAGLFLFAVRSFNGIVRSDWSPYTTKTLLGLTAPPADATGFSLIASNGFAVARWDLSPDLDVKIGGRAIIRHSPLTTGATWEDGILISGTVDLPGFPGDTVMSPPLPLKSGTYLLKFRDSSGNYSANEASFVVTEGMVTGFTTLVTITEDATFAGAKTDTVVNGSNLQLASVNLLQRTEQIDNAAWAKSNVTVTADNIVAPDGTTTADKIAATASAITLLTQTVAINAGIATYSIYIKKGSGAADANSYGMYNSSTASNLIFVSINFDTRVISYSVGSTGASVEDVGGGWLRIILTATAGITLGDLITVYAGFTTGVETAGEYSYAWGAQLEGNATASAYDKLVADRIGSVIVPAGSYAFAATDDRSSIAVRRFEATVKAISFDTGDTIDSRTTNIDTWDSMDGGSVNDCNAQMLASVSDDNVTYKPFTPFHVADFSGRYSKFRLDLTSRNPNHNIAISQLRVAIKVP